MGIRVAIISEIPTPYRQPVFERIGKSDRISAHFFYLSAAQKDRFWAVEKLKDQRETFFKGIQLCIKGYHTVHLNYGLAESFRNRAFDAYVIGGYAQPALIWLIRRCWRSKTPYVMVTESHLSKRRHRLLVASKAAFLRRVYGRSSSNLVMGTAAREYVRYYGAAESKIFPFPNTIDGFSYARLVDEKKKEVAALKGEIGITEGPVILFVGTLNRRKGVEELLKAFKTLSACHTEATLLFVGAGTWERRLRWSVHGMGLEKRVFFPGFVQPDALPKYYALADIFVLPSLEEPFGAVVCESMAAGLPVVLTSAVGAARDYVSGKKTGLIVPPGDVERLAEALDSLLSDPAARRKMGERGRILMGSWTHERLAESFFLAVEAALSQKVERDG